MKQLISVTFQFWKLNRYTIAINWILFYLKVKTFFFLFETVSLNNKSYHINMNSIIKIFNSVRIEKYVLTLNILQRLSKLQYIRIIYGRVVAKIGILCI